MRKHEEVFFSVLRTALWDQPFEVPADFRGWGRVMSLAKSQAMMGHVGDVLLKHSQILKAFSPMGLEKLQEMPLNIMAMHTTLNNTLILIVKTLRDNGIEPILLKGQGLAQYYPEPLLRQCGDIDLYVGEENYEKAYDALKPVVNDIDDRTLALNRGKHFHSYIGSVVIEVHKYTEDMDGLRVNKNYRILELDGMTKNLVQVNVGSFTVNTPGDDFNIFYVFNHLWLHFIGSGVGLRQLCDLMCLLHVRCGQYDLGYLQTQLKAFKLMRAWQVLGCVIVDYLGMPQEEYPFYNPRFRSHAERMVERILVEGNFGHETPFHKRPDMGYLAGKLFSLQFHLNRILGIARIFPREMLVRFYFMMVNGMTKFFNEQKAVLRESFSKGPKDNGEQVSE